MQVSTSLKAWFQITDKNYYSGVLFAIHRLTGLLMVGFLFLHLYAFNISLSLGYNYYKIFFAIALFHGMNGIRLGLHELGFFYNIRKIISNAVLISWLIGSVLIFIFL